MIIHVLPGPSRAALMILLLSVQPFLGYWIFFKVSELSTVCWSGLVGYNHNIEMDSVTYDLRVGPGPFLLSHYRDHEQAHRSRWS